MPANRLVPQLLLTPSEREALAGFAAAHRGVGGLPALAGFLKERFGITLNLEPEIIVGFAADSSNLPGRADALARPASERECAAVLAACFAAGVPVTLSGGRSNLTGSATPSGGVLLSTANLTAPELQLDAAARTVTAPAGILLEDMRRAVERASGGKLVFPVDPTSRAEASVGGAIACNASGFTPGETGAMRPWVQALRFLLPDGRLVAARRGELVSEGGVFLLDDGAGHARELPVPSYARPRIKNAGGPYSAEDGRMDFVDFAVGSEGLFGLTTGCTLRLAEAPADYLDLFFSLPDEPRAVRFLLAVHAKLKGDLSGLAALEYFGVNCRRHMKHESRFFRGADQVGIYIREPLRDKDMETAAGEWLELMAEAECGVSDDAVMVLDTAALRTLFMEARHSLPANALEVVQHRGTFTIMTDTVVPPPMFSAFLEFTHGLLSAEGLDYVSFGHLGDCHLHFTVLPEKAQLERAVGAYDAIVAKSAELGGVYSGEHGTGKRKRQDFLRCYGPAAVEDVRRTKLALDPELLLNRGNVFDV
ncbi:MAG TPA: FAD-binding oxidoreductase [Planctomycetota bacterium]|nr:FAD-binding oxidoreductase [Planctomycetota bacterium]